MISAVRLHWGRIVSCGIVAGIAGGVLLHAYTYATVLLPSGAGIFTLWQFIASTALGKIAFTSTAYAWIGLAMHLIVSAAWGVGYAYLAQTQRGVDDRPVLSGLVYGFVVYVVMQIALYSVQALRVTSGAQIVDALVGHCIFFGLPIAVVTASWPQRAERAQ